MHKGLPLEQTLCSFPPGCGLGMGRNSSLARSIAIRGDDLMGYGKPDYSKKWWFDLEDVEGDGLLQIPSKNK